MRASRPLLLMLAALTAGCADPEPFVDTGQNLYQAVIAKPKDPVLVNGSLPICYSDETPWDEVVALVTERCAAHGLQVWPQSSVQRWQCRATSPHRAVFQCYDPEMLTAKGQYVNPFNRGAVEAWERETGKTAKPHNFMTGPVPVAPADEPLPQRPSARDVPATTPAPQAPPPAQLTPEGMASRPAMPSPPYRIEGPPPPPPVPVPENGGFTLPQGSWGDHFQE
ncbi:MAG: hypothetical protein NVV74_03060 [Magnetospirillum sp.]|nr:hypothetical protein [Magnetospirillum sp.]